MFIDVTKLNEVAAELEARLPGLVATDIWERSTGKSLAGFNTQPAAVEMFNEMTSGMERTLEQSGFPGLARYFVLEMQGDTLVVIILHGNDVMQGMLCNSKMTNMGTLLALGLRTAIDGVKAARRHVPSETTAEIHPPA
ncbi:hypothetical protein [Nocardioides sp. GXZ039]|uniref:hypothetical protein n=1 Tax=Nocardioides sp. GXZ039 TaxID=3136018 RepID=UPI0030F3B552